MKKIFAAAAVMCAFGLYTNAQAQDLPLVGEYTNSAGYVVIAPAAKSQNANYDVGIMSNDGKCSIQIVAGTNKVSMQESPTGKVMHPNAIASVESAEFPNFSLWPEDKTIRLSDDALPFDKLDPACKVFQNNLVFTRK